MLLSSQSSTLVRESKHLPQLPLVALRSTTFMHAGAPATLEQAVGGPHTPAEIPKLYISTRVLSQQEVTYSVLNVVDYSSHA